MMKDSLDNFIRLVIIGAIIGVLLFSILLYYFCRWLFLRNIKDERINAIWRTRLKWFVALAVTLILTVCVFDFGY